MCVWPTTCIQYFLAVFDHQNPYYSDVPSNMYSVFHSSFRPCDSLLFRGSISEVLELDVLGSACRIDLGFEQAWCEERHELHNKYRLAKICGLIIDVNHPNYTCVLSILCVAR